MYWFWLNMPLAAVFFGAWTGIPLWLVFKYPDTGPGPQPLPTPLPGHTVAATAPRTASAESHRESPHLVPAGRDRQ